MRRRKRAVALVRRVLPRVGLRESDVILASYPKSGNTWMRFIWANIVSELELDGRPVDFHLLDGDMICDHNRHLYGKLEFSCLPRLVKTHGHFDRRVFRDNRVLLLVRHPGQVMESYHAYKRAKVHSRRALEMTLSEFIWDQRYGVSAWGAHAASWLEQATVIASYAALREDAEGEVGRILSGLGISHVKPETIARAVERASFASVRQLEEDRGRPDAGEFNVDFRFTRSGGGAAWPDSFDPDDVERVRAEVERRGLSDLVAV